MTVIRRHVPAVSGVLSVVALALVFAAALRAIPDWLLPRAPDVVVHAIPHVNAVVSVAAICTILLGVRAIRRGNVERHRRMMLSTTGLFGAFLVAYLYRVALEGPTDFPGPATVEQFVYYPVLGIHILLAIVCVPLVIYTLLLALTHSVAELPETRHPTVGKAAAALWLVSFALGTVVYLMLYVVY
jgi:putative membrane protein